MGEDKMAENLRDALGQVIRFYRKAQKISLDTLAEKILKSRATLCHYESGVSSMDIDTLALIAEGLNVEADVLIREANALLPAENASEELSKGAMGEYYLYFYDGRYKKLRKSLIRMARGDLSEIPAHLFYMLDDWEHPESCQVYYQGVAYRVAPCISYFFTNTGNAMERMSFIARTPFGMNGIMGGLLTGISITSMEPICFKALHSERRLAENDALIESLKTDKENLAMLKQCNGFTIAEEEGIFFRNE
jgi:transcriptional regulator with XRE-family HTH domain